MYRTILKDETFKQNVKLFAVVAKNVETFRRSGCNFKTLCFVIILAFPLILQNMHHWKRNLVRNAIGKSKFFSVIFSKVMAKNGYF